MRNGMTNNITYRKNYAAYPWNVKQLKLQFDIGANTTIVRAQMEFELKDSDMHSHSIVLDGSELELLSLSLNGRELTGDDYVIEGETLTIPAAPPSSVLETEVCIHPAANTAFEGLYLSGQFLLTQCEAQGFRKITWFPDRPDVMTTYQVTLKADQAKFPLLLSNGSQKDEGDLPDGRHCVRWEDPFPKPAYLFALVAGDLALVEDCFTTRSGLEVTLRIYVEAENLDRCEHAMESLINAMRWDEQVYGR